MNSRIHI